MARIIDVSIGTIRTVLVVRGNRLVGSILAFFEVLIWFFAAKEALSKVDSILIPIFYAGGYATGTYIGTLISSNYLDGLISLQVVSTSKLVNKMVKMIRNAGFGVSVIELNNTKDNRGKKMAIIELNKKSLKKLTSIIRSVDASAFVIINDTRYVQKGILR